MTEIPNKSNSNDRYIIDLISAGLIKDSEKVELAALTLSRRVRTQNPEFSKKINDIISSFGLTGGASLRGVGNLPVPVDNDSQLEMANVIVPDLFKYEEPVLPNSIKNKIQSFIEERNSIKVLLENNIKPSSSILLTGEPGTGKTMLAHFIATSLGKNLVILDLSSTISSLMGKTGANIKKVLQYAKDSHSVLLLDEFDAIAKKRDDNTDLGEIKRVVNVLLMELENWPVSSIFIATSNHPELLDKAIWRRFDNTIEIPLPESEERKLILEKHLGDFFLNVDNKNVKFLAELAKLTEGISAADLCKYANNVKRRIILKKDDAYTAALMELSLHSSDKKNRGNFCVIAKDLLGERITVREIAEITGLSPAGVQHHLSKSRDERK